MNKFNNKRKRHGPWEGHHINGNLMYKENYINGKKHGLIEFYWDNGNLYWMGNYVNGKASGLFERYWFDGKLNIKQYYL